MVPDRGRQAVPAAGPPVGAAGPHTGAGPDPDRRRAPVQPATRPHPAAIAGRPGTHGTATTAPAPQPAGHGALATIINARQAARPALGHATPWWLRLPYDPVPLLKHVPAALLPYSWLGLAIAIALLLNGVFLTYLVALIAVFVRHSPRPKGDSRNFGWHFLIPCRDEQAVIGGTIGYLTRHFPRAHVWVIDDASDDATGTIVQQHLSRNPNVHLVTRERPYARTGKSEALNAAYRIMSSWLNEMNADRRNTIVAVIDADGRLAPGALDVVAADHLFGNRETGAVQIEVRMINRDDRTPLPRAGRVRNLLGRVLIRLQDIEFRTVCSAVQLSRRAVHTVAMGGNGQYMRLTALDEVGGDQQRPWRGSLQEDFEIGLHVLLTGGRTEYTPDTYIDQEALPSPGRLVVQRTRWSQGMMQCIRYLPELWRSRHLSHPARAAMFRAEGGWTLLGLYVAAALTQLALWGIVYWRTCERPIGAGRAIGFGVAFSLMAAISYLATWRAFSRILRRRNGEFAGPEGLTYVRTTSAGVL